MVFYVLLWHILFIPLIFGSNVTVTETKQSNNTLPDLQNQKQQNGTTTPLISLSEGGTILSQPETLLLALPKENQAATSLDNSQDKRKIVARKGVSTTNSEEQESSASTNKTTSAKPNITLEQEKTSINLVNSTVKVLNEPSTLVQKISNATVKANKTETPHKPLILNADVLESITVKSSPETFVNNQLQSPNKVSSYINANNHPGMVMPIVITILLVPMFAVLGFMALRRGQEAWKNRHYKRMDFLLDGMYND